MKIKKFNSEQQVFFPVFKTRIKQLFVLVVGIAAIANFTVAFVWVMELASGRVEIKHRAIIR